MRILITGGAGCLGSNLIERYVPAGHPVLAIDNFATGKRQALPEVPGLTVVEGSIADAALVERCFAEFQPSHVIHSAAAYKDPADWAEDVATNIAGTINVADACRRHAVRRSSALIAPYAAVRTYHRGPGFPLAPPRSGC